MDEILWCPTQVRAFIQGLNIRVHTIGTTAYALAIVTDATDYRYAGRDEAAVEILGMDLPEKLIAQCVQLALSVQLPFAKIDLKICAAPLIDLR